VSNAEPTSVRGGVKVRRKLEVMGIDNIRLVINRFDRKAFTQLGFYHDIDDVIDATHTQLIALVPFDIRISVIMQRGVAGLNWSAVSSVFDCLALRLDGKRVPLAFKG
jgi:septum site-determining protein MinD